jgi:aspartate aminotransferase-like enzyme
MLRREPFTTDRLYCPGPTPVPKAALDAGERTSIYHRSDEFYKVFRRTAELLQPLFGCTTPPVILASSGTGAMEAALANLTDAGDEVVVVNGGKFGERWEKLAKAYQCKTEAVALEWGTGPSSAQILAAIGRQSKTKAVFIQANETSTGAYYPVERLAREIRAQWDGLLVVDCISSLGAHTMRMNDWGIDAVVAGSQKGFGLPPGLAFVGLSERAWGRLSTRPRFYFDLERERKGQAEGRSAWTPALSLVFMLHAALEQMHEVGLDQVIAHHALLADASRAAVAAMGLTLFPKDFPSNALTSIVVPAGVDGQKLVKRVRQRFGMFFAGGQDQLKGKIVRFAHLGFVSRFDVLDGLAALEFALHEEGFRLDLGAGVKAAMVALARSDAAAAKGSPA